MSEPRTRRVFRRMSLLLVIPLAALWTSLGPAPKQVSAQTSQAYTWKNVVTGGGGGFIPGIVFNTSQPNLIYARTDIGGAYRWNQTTSTWTPLMDFVSFDDWNALGVESIATDPVDPTRFYVAAGTYTNNFTSANGAILRSTDEGNTFARTNLPFKLGGNMPGRSMGERLAIDPNLNSTIYFGTRSGHGLWKSTDFGVTWNQVASFTAQGNYVQTAGDNYLGDPDGIVWEVFDPRTGTPGHATQTIYVGIANLSTSIYKSIDGGNTWAAVAGQPTGFLPHHGVLASDGTLYITYNNNAGPYDGTSGDVWKLNTATGVWTKISPVPSTDTTNDYFGYGGLAVDAQHPSTIMVSALNSWWPDTIIFRSIDGGTTWTRIWDFTSYPNRSLRYVQDISAAPWLNFGVTNPVPPVPSPKLGWMVGAMAIDPFNSNRLMYGTGATLYGCNDLTSWDSGGMIHISVMAGGIEETSVLDLVSPPSGASLISALGDVGGFVHTSLTAAPSTMFTAPIFTSGSSVDFAELNPSFIVRVGTVDKTLSPAPNSSGFTFNGGSSWFQGNSEPGGITTGGGSVAAAADASRVVWGPAGQGVFFSADNGNSWTASTGVPSGGRVASDRVNPMKFYAFANGTFYVSTNGGASFAASSATGLPPSGTSVRFRAVAGHEGDIWLAGGATGVAYGLWHSTDSGATFTKLTSVTAADTIGFGKAAAGQPYVALFTNAVIGGVRGFFRSDDGGATWIRINDDQHQWGLTGAAITGDPRIYGRVYISTNGRGIIYGDIGAATPDFSLSDNPASLTVVRGASGTSTVTVNPSGGFSSSVALTATGMPAGVTATFSPTSTTGTSTLTLAASSTASTGTASIAIAGTGGGITHTGTLSLTVNPVATPNFTLSASPASLTVTQGASGTSTITVTPSGGFTSSVALTATGMPTGVTATFNPTSTGTTSTLTLASAGTATTGTATITVSGTGGGITHTATISLTVNPITTPNFALSASPGTLTVSQGASGTSTITVTPSGGFTSSVALTATGMPTGVTATFSPASTTGTSTLTLAASATATTGTATITVSGTGGGITHTTPISLIVTTGGSGGVTVTPVVASSGGFFNEEDIKLANTGTLTALSITIVVQRTTGISFNGQYNTVGSQITQANNSTASAITFTYTLASGQTLGAGSGWTFGAQTSGTGTTHPTTGDLWTVTYTTGGVSHTQTGHF